jgi:squalene-hopene/tetraprenyl-beta-curcumene cyclase
MSTRLFAVALLGLAVTFLPTRAAGPDAKELKAVNDKAIAALRKMQKANGSFGAAFMAPGVTALATAALIKQGAGPDDPTVAKALKYLEGLVKKDGGIHGGGLANYTTCVAIMALKEANKGGKYDAVLKKAGAYLKKLQENDPASKGIRLGGVTYNGDGKGQPDLSNTQYFVEALLAAGVPKDDPAVKRALKFVTRCQNFPNKEEGNDLPFAMKAKEDDKGGFTYKIDTDDEGHVVGGGGLRSQGAMTYGGLKSFLYAGVKKDDPRVKAALGWIAKHYTLEENPGLKQAGLYYYYHTFAKAMAALGDDTFKTADGKSHDWRAELFAALKKRQGKDGGFVNPGEKTFMEQDPALATSFALLALSYCKK